MPLTLEEVEHIAKLARLELSDEETARYREQLSRGFPRIPLTHDGSLFATLAALGAELIDLHLLRSPLLAASGSRLGPQGSGTLGSGKRWRRGYPW